MILSDAIRQHINKIRALMDDERAPEGERIAAKKMLERAMKKHGLTMADLQDSELQMYTFRYKDEHELRILIQLIGKVCDWNLTDRVYTFSGRRMCRGVKLTPVEHAELSGNYEHYRAAWAKALKDYMSAFLQINDLCAPAPDNAREISVAPPMSAEEWRKFKSLMSSIGKSLPPSMQLGAGS